MAKLTLRFVKALEPQTKGDAVIFDDDLPGFGIRVKPAGAKSWLVQYRNSYGVSRRLTLGRFGAVTPDEARKRARKLMSAVADGADPAADRQEARIAITVGELCDQYLKAGETTIKASTLRMDRSRIERHVKPLLGSRKVASLTPADMERFLRDIIEGKTAEKLSTTPKSAKRRRGGIAKGGAGAGSRTLGMLGTILERAVRDGTLVKNPTRGVARPRDNENKPPFSFERIGAIGTAMRELEMEGEGKVGLQAVRFLLTSGCRREEVLSLRYGTIDRPARCLRFEDTKTGKQLRPIGRPVLELVAMIQPKDAKPGTFVFPGTGKKGHFVGLPKVWDRICARAKIDGVSIHGMRHWFASAATELNYSELTIAGLLGHKVKGITARYATVPDSALLAAADRVSLRIAQALNESQESNVVSIGAA